MNSRNFLPKSLFWRVLLIFIMGLMLLQFAAIGIFFDRHWDNITKRLSSVAAGDIAYVVHQFESAETSKWGDIKDSANHYFNLQLQFSADAKLSEATKAAEFYQDAPIELLHKSIDGRIENNFLINAYGKVIEVVVETSEGLLYISFAKKRIFSSTIYVFLFVTVLSSIVLVGLAMAMIRKQINPILRLTKTADAFGKGRDSEIEPLTPQGADEIRLATIAFNRMQGRIRRQIRQRTEMLAGVSHDLRTPITRMKLELELLPDSIDATRLKDDLHSMEAMIESYLTFAKGEGSEESVTTNLGELLQNTTRAWNKNSDAKIILSLNDNLDLPIKVNAFRRCLDNLLGNAVRYGQQIEVSLSLENKQVVITIDDDGEGIPEDKRDQVFRPFYRLEKSRSQETGGYGLGLSIARDIVRVHGGDIELQTAPADGLRVIITLPL